MSTETKLQWTKLETTPPNVKEAFRLFNEAMFVQVQKVGSFGGNKPVWCVSAPSFYDNGLQLGCTVISKAETMKQAKLKAEQWLKRKCEDIMEKLG